MFTAAAEKSRRKRARLAAGVLLRVASCAASSVNGSADPRQVSPGSTPPPRYTTSHSHPVAATGHWDRAVVAPPGPAAPREKRHSAPNKSTHTVHDVPAEVFETIEGEDDDEFMECSFPLPAAAQRSNHSQLVTALLGMATASPAEPLAGRYLPTGELTNAGQALVAYARSGGDEGDELAIKCAAALACERMYSAIRIASRCMSPTRLEL